MQKTILLKNKFKHFQIYLKDTFELFVKNGEYGLKKLIKK